MGYASALTEFALLVGDTRVAIIACSQQSLAACFECGLAVDMGLYSAAQEEGGWPKQRRRLTKINSDCPDQQESDGGASAAPHFSDNYTLWLIPGVAAARTNLV